MEQEIKNEICSFCHQPILSQYYFCPNCGTKINSAPLSTTIGTQIGIYVFSIILPLICFIFITRWQGLKYFKSNDPKAKRIGEVAFIILILSTIIFFWMAFVWTQQAVQSTLNTLNADMGSISF